MGHFFLKPNWNVICSTNASTATCITSSYSDLPKEDSIEMTFDNGRRKLEGKYFTYVDDSEMFVWSGGVAEAGVVSHSFLNH